MPGFCGYSAATISVDLLIRPDAQEAQHLVYFFGRLESLVRIVKVSSGRQDAGGDMAGPVKGSDFSIIPVGGKSIH